MKYIWLIAFLLFYSKLYSQDTLFLRNGKTLPVYIKAINSNEIIYKAYSNPNGLSHYIRKDSVATVHFGDSPGKSLVFTPPPVVAKPLPPTANEKALNDARSQLRNAIIFQVLAPAAYFSGGYLYSYHVTTYTSASYSNSNMVGTLAITSYPYKNASYLFFAGSGVMEAIALIDFIHAGASFKKGSKKTAFFPAKNGIGMGFEF